MCEINKLSQSYKLGLGKLSINAPLHYESLLKEPNLEKRLFLKNERDHDELGIEKKKSQLRGLWEKGKKDIHKHSKSIKKLYSLCNSPLSNSSKLELPDVSPPLKLIKEK